MNTTWHAVDRLGAGTTALELVGRSLEIAGAQMVRLESGAASALVVRQGAPDHRTVVVLESFNPDLIESLAEHLGKGNETFDSLWVAALDDNPGGLAEDLGDVARPERLEIRLNLALLRLHNPAVPAPEARLGPMKRRLPEHPDGLSRRAGWFRSGRSEPED